ncbi:MAG TPA: hypothetical protein V6C65_29350 [Allocoleopsis sp.]
MMTEQIISATTTILKTVLEYGELASRAELSEAELDRMEYILIQASNDPVLDFWIGEIDYCLGYRLNLMGEDLQPDEENKQVVLGRYLESVLYGMELNLKDGEASNLESKVHYLLTKSNVHPNRYSIVSVPEPVKHCSLPWLNPS